MLTLARLVPSCHHPFVAVPSSHLQSYADVHESRLESISAQQQAGLYALAECRGALTHGIATPSSNMVSQHAASESTGQTSVKLLCQESDRKPISRLTILPRLDLLFGHQSAQHEA